MSERTPEKSEPVAASEIAPERSASAVDRRRRWLIRIAVFVGVGYASWCGVLYVQQDGMVFPRQLAPQPLAEVPAYVREMTITTEDGHTVPGWFVSASSHPATRPGPAVIFFHGNAEIIDHEPRIERLWRDLGVSLLLPEYRGYGRATRAGEPSERALVADGVKFFDALAARPEVDPARIIIHGYSIGGGVAAQVAGRRKPAALILESTFTSVAQFGWGYGVPPFLAKHPFRTDAVLSTIDVPLFIAHGRRDRIVPVEHGRDLHALVPTSTYLELDCGHLDLPGPGSGGDYLEHIRAFLVRSKVLAPRACE